VVNFLKPAITNRLVAGITAFTFTTAVMAPPPAYAAGINLDVAAINFGIKVEKIYEKVKKCMDKGETNKIVGYMFDFKNEVEQYTGHKFDINKTIDQAQKEAKSRGQKVDDKYIKAIKKEFGKQDKKHKHRAVWFAQCAEVDIPYSTFEADTNFEMNYMMAKSAHKGKGNDVEIEDVPITIMVGVTVSLCGLFLCFVPLPGCQVAGGWLLSSGVSILGGDAIKRWDDYDQEQRKKNK
jgi:hypothetical protein